MSTSEQKVLQYLDEAQALERAQQRELHAQILMTPRGCYRSALERHLQETREHAERLERRMEELREGCDPLAAFVGLAEHGVGHMPALAKSPLELIRASGGEEKVLENAKDTCASEEREIATYTALEHFARAANDHASASLAASIRAEEEKMLQRVLRELPHLTDAVARVALKRQLLRAHRPGRDGCDRRTRGGPSARRSSWPSWRSTSASARNGRRSSRGPAH
jgi:ferritin-like metal-binding protein YciE